MKKHIHYLILFFLLGLPSIVFSTHIVGGSLTYVYNGGSSYTITLKLFRDCTPGTASFPGSVTISVLGYNGMPFTPSRNITMTLGPVTPVPANLPPCAQQPNPMPCTQQGIYTTTVNNLPPNPGGYHLFFQIVARNLSLSNVNASGNNVGESFYAYIPGPTVNWIEEFTMPNGTTIDNGATAWSTSAGVPAPASAQVNGNLFTVTGANGASQTWTSQTINIASMTGGANLSVNLSELGTLETDDSIFVYYSLNGGPLIPFAVNGTITDDFTNAIASQTGIVGATIRIVIRVHYGATSDNTEKYQFDNIQVFGNDFIPNSNPTFNIFPPLFLCANMPFTFDHSATDINGDSLVYEFYTPYNGENGAGPLDPSFTNNTANFTPVTFLPGYSVTAPLGGAPLTLNSSTGLLSGTPTMLGQFVVGILVKEYRNGVLISETLRDFQFNVVNCPQTLAVTIGPQNPTICFGGTSTTISALPTGGTPNYTYLWNNAVTSQSVSVGVGTFSVTVTDATGCQVFASVNVTAFASPITVNIGPDINRCSQLPTAVLNGTVTAASGGIWSSGAGTFSPNNTTLTNVSYTPTAAEITAGFTNLYLTTTGNGTCPADKDTVRINYIPFQGTIASSVTPVSCFGGTNGTATATITGGTAPITYLWNTVPSQATQTATNLAIGTYSVTVTDGTGCTLQSSATITQPPLLTLNTSVSTTSCAGGNITTSVAGGTPPYTYAWLPGGQTTPNLTTVPAGTYTVTVTDAKGCQVTKTAINTQPLPLAVSITNTNVSCFGGTNGTANSTVSGGTTPYTYSWSTTGATSPNVTGLAAGVYTLTVRDNLSCAATATVTITQPTVLNLTTTVTNETCNYLNNGSATATGSGGTPGYTYLWQPGGQTTTTISNLASGTYTATITDLKGCTQSAFAIITEPAPLTATFGSQTNVSCFGGNNGSVTAIATGGTPGYTYLWQPGNISGATISNLAIGTYSVTITDLNSCQATNNITITQPTAALNNTGTVVNVSCFGGANGTITTSTTGGTAPYTYLWSPGNQTTANITGLIAGVYTLVVTDSKGCTKTVNYTVTQPTVIDIVLTGTNLTCYTSANGSITSAVSGGTPAYTYTWSPGNTHAASVSNIAAGTYTLTVKDALLCAKTATIIITQPPALTVTTTKTNETCDYANDGTATANPAGGTAPYTYSWAPTGQTTNPAIGLASGIHTVTVTDNNGCIKTATATITQPNPLVITFTNQVNVKCFGGANGSVRGVPSGGTPGYTYLWAPSGATTATTNNLVMGTYTLTVTDVKGCQVQNIATITQPAAPLTVTANATPALCFGTATGALSATPSGGTSPYLSFTWMPGNIIGQNISNLAIGTYTVTVKDNQLCTATATTTITQPTKIVPVLSTVSSTCGNANGEASASVTGGISPYTYQWFPTGGTGSTTTPIASGTYSVIVTDANNCTGTQSVNLNDNSGPSATIFATTNVSCHGGNDGSASVGVVGGTGTLTYQWLPSGGNGPVATGLTAGLYTVSVVDANGCQSSATTSPPITEPPLIEITVTPTDVDCFGGSTGSATGAATGGTGILNYLWLPSNTPGTSISGLNADTYTLQVTDANNCIQTQPFVINQPTAVLTVLTSATPTSCFNGSNGTAAAVATGGTGPYSYLWTPGNINNDTAFYLQAGNYNVNVIDSNGCTASNAISVTQPTQIVLTGGSNSSTCGNSNGSATIIASGGTGSYTYFWTPDNLSTSIISGVPEGMHYVLVKDANNCSAIDSVIVSNIPGPVVSVVSQTDITCNGGSNATATTSVTGGTGTITYLWEPNGGTASIGTGLGLGIYTVTATDANGCQSQAITNEISQPSAITINVITEGVFCFGGSDGVAHAAAAGGTPGYTYTWLPSNATGSTLSGLSAGTYSVKATDNNNCIYIQSFDMTQPSTAVSVSLTSTPVSCFDGNNGTATAVASGGTSPYTYVWNNGLTSTTIENLSTGNYSVIATDTNGCVTTATVTVTQPAQTLSATGVGGITSCFNGNDGTAFVTPSGGTPGYTYSWSPSGGTGQTATGLSPGTYIVLVKDTNNCTTNTSVVITEPTQITGSILIVNPSCGLANGALHTQVSGGNGPYTYSWSAGTDTTASITGLNPGSYTVQVHDSKNCLQTFSTSITNIPGPTVAIAGSTPTSCNGGSDGTASINITQGTLPYSISWSPTGGNAVTATGLTAGTYTAYVTDSLGCIDSLAIVTITEPSAVSLAIDSITNVSCSGGNNATITVAAVGGTPGYTYSWLPVSNTSATITNLGAGTYTVIAKDQNLCVATISIPITQPTPLSSSVASVTNPTCFGETGTASVSVSGGTIPYSYSWNSTPVQTGSTADLIAGTYTATITDANGCIQTNTVTLVQPALVATNGGPDKIICVNNSTTLTANASGGSGGFTYTWFAPLTSNTTGSFTTPNLTTTTSYTVIAKDSLGCAGSEDTIKVTVYDLNPASIDVIGDSLICHGRNMALFLQVSGNTGPLSISWNFAINGIPATGPGAFMVTPFVETTYIATVTNQCGSIVVDSVQVKFNPQPTIIIPPTQNICAPNYVQFTDSSFAGNPNDPIISWLWNFGDGTTSDFQNPTHYYNSPGTYDVSLTVSTAGGCTSNNTNTPSTIHAYPFPIAGFNVNATTLNIPGEQLICTNQSSNDAVNYLWTFGDGQTSTDINPQHMYTSIGSFQVQLIATNQYGCSDTAVKSIITDADFTFPTAFTPSLTGPNGGAYTIGDLTNNVFFPYTSGVDEYKLQIFNRWGELIFESNDIKVGWDGYYRGKLCQQDVYVWKAYMRLNNGKEYNKTGDITLLQ